MTGRKLGRRGFNRVFRELTATYDSDSTMEYIAQELKELRGDAYGILARRCSKLTEREAVTVLKALTFHGIGYETDADNPLWKAVQRQFGRWTLIATTDKLVAIVSACCMFDPDGTHPYPEMVTAMTRSQEQLESLRQGFRETFFGLSTKRTNRMRGDALSLLCGGQIPSEDFEWFGANWKRVEPVWEALIAGDSVNRSRAEVLTDKSFSDVPDALMDGAL